MVADITMTTDTKPWSLVLSSNSGVNGRRILHPSSLPLLHDTPHAYAHHTHTHSPTHTYNTHTLICAHTHTHTQALIGVTFSLGFLFGPMIGAAFSILGRQGGAVDSFTTFQYPALFALTLAAIDILFVATLFRESLPPERRVGCKSLRCIEVVWFMLGACMHEM